ncbi:hypothetical protein SESBI_28506 [Sesbania bispinosa]|nr:hypothetical protein SESBI_28506 [Sesbania bispinosa]
MTNEPNPIFVLLLPSPDIDTSSPIFHPNDLLPALTSTLNHPVSNPVSSLPLDIALKQLTSSTNLPAPSSELLSEPIIDHPPPLIPQHSSHTRQRPHYLDDSVCCLISS